MRLQYKPNIQPIRVVIIAVGGDGGGILTQWMVKLGERCGYWAQSTTIAGVAQRTGSTVYYLEFIPLNEITINGIVQTPVLAQMPEQNKVDLVIATEILEAGRAIQRGFVSGITTIIFSSHRNLVIQEKEIPGDGINSGEEIFKLVKKYAKKIYFGNFKSIAEKNNSVISSSLFGAIAGSFVLPFNANAFEDTIKESGVSVKNSLNAFHEANEYVKIFEKSTNQYKPNLAPTPHNSVPKNVNSSELQALLDDLCENFPSHIQSVVWTGILQLTDWQNIVWAKTYVDILKKYIETDKQTPSSNFQLSENIARYLAIAMSYNDLVNVADLKTRSERWQSVYKQVEAEPNDVVNVVDYLHPGYDEVVGFLPVSLGKALSKNNKVKVWFEKHLDKDRRMNTNKMLPFLLLYVVGGMKRWRMKTFRHYEEMQNINTWLDRIDLIVKHNYALAVLIAKTYRLKKGYGDTYLRGDSKFKSINELALRYQFRPQINDQIEYLIQFGLNNYDNKKFFEKITEIETILKHIDKE